MKLSVCLSIINLFFLLTIEMPMLLLYAVYRFEGQIILNDDECISESSI